MRGRGVMLCLVMLPLVMTAQQWQVMTLPDVSTKWTLTGIDFT